MLWNKLPEHLRPAQTVRTENFVYCRFPVNEILYITFTIIINFTVLFTSSPVLKKLVCFIVLTFKNWQRMSEWKTKLWAQRKCLQSSESEWYCGTNLGMASKKDICCTEGSQVLDDFHNSEIEEVFEQLAIPINLSLTGQKRMSEYP